MSYFTESSQHTLRSTVNEILAAPSNGEQDQLYKRVLKQISLILEKGKAAELEQALSAYFNTKRLNEDGMLVVPYKKLQYYFVIFLDEGLYTIECPVPKLEEETLFETRQRAFELCRNGSKHVPAYLKELGMELSFGVFFTSGRTKFPIAGFKYQDPRQQAENLDIEYKEFKRLGHDKDVPTEQLTVSGKTYIVIKAKP